MDTARCMLYPLTRGFKPSLFDASDLADTDGKLPLCKIIDPRCIQIGMDHISRDVLFTALCITAHSTKLGVHCMKQTVHMDCTLFTVVDHQIILLD